MRNRPSPIVVAIPAKDEADRIGACLAALEAQRDAPPIRVVLLLNNTTDDSASVAASVAARGHLAIDIQTRDLPPGEASAGIARHLAMRWAAGLVADDGVLLTTDADGRASPDWIADNLRELRRVDAVAGRAVIDHGEAALIPARLHEDDARECAYAALLDEITCLLDPDPADPWPRHDEHSGASIAVRAGVYRAAGGMPAIPSGEDRAFFAALRRIDARVRHAPEVWVEVSGRIEGRAVGGMADTIRRRLAVPDRWLDDRLEPATAAARRARLRRIARWLHHDGATPVASLAATLRLSPALVRAAFAAETFGAAWEVLEARSTVLRRRRVRVAALATQTSRAIALRDRLLNDLADDRVDTVHGARSDRYAMTRSLPV